MELESGRLLNEFPYLFKDSLYDLKKKKKSYDDVFLFAFISWKLKSKSTIKINNQNTIYFFTFLFLSGLKLEISNIDFKKINIQPNNTGK